MQLTRWQQRLLSRRLVLLIEVTQLDAGVLGGALARPGGRQPPAARVDALTGALLCGVCVCCVRDDLRYES